jgi:hypothetical protein
LTRALKQGEAHILFQPAYRRTQGRLGHMQALRCPAKVQFGSHHNELLQLPEICHFYGSTEQKQMIRVPIRLRPGPYVCERYHDARQMVLEI